MSDKVEIVLRINGARHTIRVEPRKTLVDAIREDCGLTGTHIGCEHGVCGACTVIVGGEAVRSCLMFAVQANHRPIRTVEGLAKDGVLHPLQRAFMAHHALQCGFCTPGFLMLAVAMLEQDASIGEEQMREVLASNLCRCTGYHNIVAAVKAAQAEMRPKEPAKTQAATPATTEVTAPTSAEPAGVPELLEQSETAFD
jgi:carbon-monoxide dehydrogenase small subunit